MTDTTARIPTDAGILSLAYDCSALPETCTDATLLVFAHAVLAKWGARPVAAPAGMEPVARIRYERNTPGRENEMPRVVSCNRMADGIYEVFTESQVQAMLTAAPIKTLEEAIAHAEDKAKGNSTCAMEHAKLAAWLTELQLLRAARTAQRDVAIGMLADWVNAVNTNGTGWDDWDEHFKDAAFRPGPLRELLDEAIAARAAQRDVV